MMKNDVELNPCPNCGGEAEICIRHEKDTERYVVKCMDCGATTTPPSLSKVIAAEIWNECQVMNKECPTNPPSSITELRPCLVSGKTAFFHKWAEYSDVVAPSPMVGGAPGGVIKSTLAIVEYEGGTVSRCYPEEIKFLDRKED